jgi:hypothetical protein
MDKRLQLSFQKKNVVHFSIKYDIWLAISMGVFALFILEEVNIYEGVCINLIFF